MAAPILCDFWYARELPGVVDDFEAVARERLGAARAAHWLGNRWLRGLLLLHLMRDYAAVAPNWYTYGRLFCIVNALTRRKPAILFECIDFDIAGQRAPVRFAYELFCRFILAPAMRATVVALQVMTARERESFADRYGIACDRIKLIPWPLSGWGRASELPSPGKDDPSSVFASGRAACDWDTLFEAARRGGWRLSVACGRRDLAHVQALNADGRVDIYCDLPAEAHDALLRRATVYVVSLREQNKSSGQARLADAIAARVPVVGTAVTGIEGYLIDGVTGVAIRPGDADAMAGAVSALIADPAAAAALTEAAAQHAERWSKADYFKTVADFAAGAR
ncbi:glycosyltransferase family 4 protein [Sphingomonas sp.]|uniref:glycosyltransferase family 4 protein n=1 Tax=Sphingomonas sp. TaxID=28214 RepID=UPI002ED82614